MHLITALPEWLPPGRLGTQRATGAVIENPVMISDFARRRRTAPVANVRCVLLAEVPEGSQNRIGRRLAQPAAASSPDLAADLLKVLQVRCLSLAIAYAFPPLPTSAGYLPDMRGSIHQALFVL